MDDSHIILALEEWLVYHYRMYSLLKPRSQYCLTIARMLRFQYVYLQVCEADDFSIRHLYALLNLCVRKSP